MSWRKKKITFELDYSKLRRKERSSQHPIQSTRARSGAAVNQQCKGLKVM